MNRCLLSLVVFCLFCTACGEDDTGQESMNEVIRINPMMNDRSDFGVDNAGNEAGTMVEAGGDVVGGSVAGTTVVDAGNEAGTIV